jgi:Flp pilus assembly pilin Flp
MAGGSPSLSARERFSAALEAAHATPPEWREVEAREVRQLGSVRLIVGTDQGNGERVVFLPSTRMGDALAMAIVDRRERPVVTIPGWSCLSLDALPPEPHDWDAASAIGQGLAEYALLLGLIAVIAIVSLLALGGAISGMLSAVAASI